VRGLGVEKGVTPLASFCGDFRPFRPLLCAFHAFYGVYLLHFPSWAAVVVPMWPMSKGTTLRTLPVLRSDGTTLDAGTYVSLQLPVFVAHELQLAV
jgi:hypothetical protein